MLKNTTLAWSKISVLFLLLSQLGTSSLHAQCAGEDSNFSYCSKETGRYIDLFDILDGNPQSGGIWTDGDQDRGLNTSTGSLDTYALMMGGVYEYTYTVTTEEECTNNTASVTLTLGAYAGRDNDNAVVCADAGSVNLFQFSGSGPSPTIDGQWSSLSLPDDVLSGSNGRFFNVETAEPGSYEFVYNVPAYGDCPASMSTIILEVAQTPQSGAFVQPVFCESDDLSGFTQFNLRGVLTGEDAGGVWSETAQTNEISGPGDSRINVERLRNTLGPGIYSFTYTVNPINPTCTPSATTVTILIEEVLDFSGTSFSLLLNNDEDSVCIDQLPVETTGTLNVDPNQVPDGPYEISYEVRGGNNQGSETIEINIEDGTADFEINPGFFSDAAEVTVAIVSIIDPNTETGCQVPLNDVSDSFIINALPDLSDTSIEVSEPICFGEDVNVTLSDVTDDGIQLQDGTYTISYTLAGPSTETQIIEENINITGGTGSFTVDAAAISAPGETELSLTSISSANGCTVNSTISETFIITPRPDATGLNLSIENTCVGETITAILTSGEATTIQDGTYSIGYNLSGDNIQEDQTLDELIFEDGTASFELPESALNPGTTTLTLVNFQTTEASCNAINLTDLSSTFTISPFPDLSVSELNIPPVCALQTTSLTVVDSEDNIPDGIYAVTYTLSSIEGSTNYNATMEFSGGSGTLVVPANSIEESMEYTLRIDSFENSVLSCPALGLPRETTFEVYNTPELDSATLNVPDVCFGEPVIATLNDSEIENGSYTISYAVSGTNPVTERLRSIEFLEGEASFTIPEDLLQNSGENRLDIISITNENPNLNCITETSLATDFSINALPNAENLTLSLQNPLCLGDVAVINVAASDDFMDGDYTFTYSLSGSNSVENEVQTLPIASGSGSITLPASQLENSGITRITVTGISNDATGCATTVVNLSIDFEVNLPPDLNGASLSVSDFCAASGNPLATVNAPNLTDGNYALAYTIDGANTYSEVISEVNFTDGTANFEIPEASVTNAGQNTITLTSFTSETCSTENLSISTNFIVNAVPGLQAEDLSVASICLGENSTLQIDTNTLEDGDYSVTYTLQGDNSSQPEIVIITVSEGSASFVIDSGKLTESGNTIFTIESIVNVVTGCQSNESLSTSFEVFPLPELQEQSVMAMDVCAGEAGMVSISDASNLPTGVYTVSYRLSGDDSTEQTTTVQIEDFSGIIEIPAELLVSPGTFTFNVQEIISETGCTSGPLDLNATFEVLPRPDASGLNYTIENICLNSEATVFIDGGSNLQDGEYTLTYQLDGSNTQTETRDVVFTNGSTSISLPPALLLNAGSTSFRLVELQDFLNQCGAINIPQNTISFEVQDPGTPDLTTDGNQFCINDQPTVADLLARLSGRGTITIFNAPSEGTGISNTTPLTNGTTYYASQSNALGCESSERLAITVDLSACDNIMIPEAFSPNGDGINDRFVIENINLVYPDYTIEIFNRNGTIVYKGNASTDAWDGSANQNRLGSGILPNGVYFYIINYNNGTTSPLQGNLYLNR